MPPVWPRSFHQDWRVCVVRFPAVLFCGKVEDGGPRVDGARALWKRDLEQAIAL